jgi:hypothetical protein
MGEVTNAYIILVRKPEEKRALGGRRNTVMNIWVP